VLRPPRGRLSTRPGGAAAVPLTRRVDTGLTVHCRDESVPRLSDPCKRKDRLRIEDPCGAAARIRPSSVARTLAVRQWPAPAQAAAQNLRQLGAT
jgi:hypothetical protein